ncbi:MAG: M20/M25/M40 family metallo-hydrolase [Gemmatimonadaceae bacterium]
MSAASEIRELFRALEPERAYCRTHEQRMLNQQVALAEVPAPTGGEATRARLVAERLREIGQSAEIDAAGNVIARLAGRVDDAPVIVCAHLDTVFSSDTTHAVRKRGGVLLGPGISDNARGLAAMLGIAEMLATRTHRSRRPVFLCATTGEEGDGDLRGARFLFDHAARAAHAAIALDGAGDDRIVSHALGCARLRISIQGPGGHSWAAFGAPNPIHAIGALIARISALPLPTSPRATLSVGRVGGGTAINAIPRDGWIDIDIRSTSGEVLRRLVADVEHHAHEAVLVENLARLAGTEPLQLTISPTGERPAGAMPENAPLVRIASEVTRAIGRHPQLAVASTDANVPMSLGIPAIAIGAGGKAGQTHTPDEWFDPSDGHLGIARALTIIAAAAELA